MSHPFSDRLLSWYEKNKRDLPWRETKDPYSIWLSEIILQQTRVAQGLPYYKRFIKNYPTVQQLAAASEQDVLKLWQGLGYYSRARNLHYTAKYITDELKGEFPTSYKGLLPLKGVGDYTASAIASFCYDEVTPTVDGNVYRLLARYFGIETPINSSAAKNEFKALAQELIDPKKPAIFNQAIMEFGALQCTPKKPNCSLCPLSGSCVALQKKWVSVLPKKIQKLKIRHRYFNYLVVQTAELETVLRKREDKGIWQRLYEFPLVETAGEIDMASLLNEERFIAITQEMSFVLSLLSPKAIIHKLSHQHLHIKFWLLKTKNWDTATITEEQALSLPVPIVIHNFMKSYWAGQTHTHE